ncbi:hypothetical protein RN001_003608 [Aquatica leii]|uniref:Uncharacterized protein n=1 Tax=Aquatica leii TaxID=1421715 RepID=A0AAN7PIK9_9COLE|nr:hypothetical protein RN001_003608 [Aquatica leii]
MSTEEQPGTSKKRVKLESNFNNSYCGLDEREVCHINRLLENNDIFGSDSDEESFIDSGSEYLPSENDMAHQEGDESEVNEISFEDIDVPVPDVDINDAIVVIVSDSTFAEDFACKEGVSYIANDCSDCVCAPNGNFGCTLKACVIPGQKDKGVDCEAGTTFQKDCNKCWCVKHGGVICENEDCEVPIASGITTLASTPRENDDVYLGYFRQIIRKQSIIQATLLQLIEDMKSIKDNSSPVAATNVNSIFTLFDFPLKEEASLQQFEEYLSNEQQLNEMVCNSNSDNYE